MEEKKEDAEQKEKENKDPFNVREWIFSVVSLSGFFASEDAHWTALYCLYAAKNVIQRVAKGEFKGEENVVNIANIKKTNFCLIHLILSHC
jgi:hypothetical protein